MMLNKISKRSGATAIAQTLRGARLGMGLTQRQLGARANLPQAQISRIESGDVDPQLSTLTELARSLNLEIQLVPRSALTAVEAVLKDSEARSVERGVRRRLADLDSLAQDLVRRAPEQSEAPELQSVIGELHQIAPMLQTEAARHALEQTADRLRAAVGQNGQASIGREIEHARRSLQSLRNNHVHTPSRPRPAYSLDDED